MRWKTVCEEFGDLKFFLKILKHTFRTCIIHKFGHDDENLQQKGVIVIEHQSIKVRDGGWLFIAQTLVVYFQIIMEY